MPIHDEILTKLRQNDPGLTTLDLSNQNLKAEDIHILLQALVSNSALTELNLRGNEIGDEGAKALAENKILTQLGLSRNKIGAEGAKALARNRTLTRLDLHYNQIGDEGAEALARNRTLTQLYLAKNQIGDEGAKALAGNVTLTQLDLIGNQIGDEGAKALAENKTLTQLSLEWNQIGAEGAKAFLDNFTLIQFGISGKQISASLEAKVMNHINTYAAPTLNLSSTGSIRYLEKEAPVILDAGITLRGNEKASILGATIAITSHFACGEDKLHFADQEGITGSYDSATGVLTLSGLASLSAYQSALRSIGYENTSENPSTATRTITLTLRGGGGRTHSVSCSLGVIAVNDPPRVVNPLPPFELLVNELGNYTLPVGTFEDPEGEELRLWAKTVTNESLPEWIQFDSATQTFSIFSPAAGRYPVRVLASDPSNGTVFNDFFVEVKSKGESGGLETSSFLRVLGGTVLALVGSILFHRFGKGKTAKAGEEPTVAAQLRVLLNLTGVANVDSAQGRQFVEAVNAWTEALLLKGIDLKGLDAGERQKYLLETKSILQASAVLKKSWFGRWSFDTALFHKGLATFVEELIQRIPVAQESCLAPGLQGEEPLKAKPAVNEVLLPVLTDAQLSPVAGQGQGAESEEALTSGYGRFFPPLVDEEQAEKARAYALAVGLQNVITTHLPVAVTIDRGEYVEIQAKEKEALDDSYKALGLTLARLFGSGLLVLDNRYRIAWSSLSAGQSEAFVSLYDAECQCLLDASETKTLTFSEAETLKTADFVDALDNDPRHKVKIAAALQTLIEERLTIGVSMSIQGLSEVLPEEQSKAQALRETLKVLTIGSSARFSEDSITLPWESLRAKYVREFNATYESQLMRLESAASKSFKH